MSKRFICLLLSIISLFSLSGCSNNQDIKSQITAMLDCYTQGNMAKMKTYTLAVQQTFANTVER